VRQEWFLLNILTIIFNPLKIPFMVITIGEEALFLISLKRLQATKFSRLLKAMRTHHYISAMNMCFMHGRLELTGDSGIDRKVGIPPRLCISRAASFLHLFFYIWRKRRLLHYELNLPWRYSSAGRHSAPSAVTEYPTPLRKREKRGEILNLLCGYHNPLK
jgi:hypothetical protein